MISGHDEKRVWKCLMLLNTRHVIINIYGNTLNCTCPI